MSDILSTLVPVAISERTRKILWAMAGARCSICREPLAGEPADDDDPSVFGEEAHIVARSPGGPRFRAYAGDVDGYRNLILLCSRHHKEIDDQVNTYPDARLLEIKSAHEKWNAELGKKPNPAESAPKRLKLFISGSEFWHYFDGCVSFTPSWMAGLGDEREDVIYAFIEELEDWMDIAGGTGVSYREKREASRAMGRYITELAKAGFLLCGRKRRWHHNDDSGLLPNPLVTMDIEIQPAFIALAPFIDDDGNPLTVDQARSKLGL